MTKLLWTRYVDYKNVLVAQQRTAEVVRWMLCFSSTSGLGTGHIVNVNAYLSCVLLWYLFLLIMGN